MKSDLIFHIVSRRKWPGLNKNGYYKPENLDEIGGITCVEADQLQNQLNQEFNGRKNLLILVIDSSRLTNKIYREKESLRVSVEGGINVDAILDKIRIDCSPDGTFDIDVSTK